MSDAAQKTFDSVQTMRTIRDRLTSEIAAMTIEEEIHWLRLHTFADETLRRLMANRAHQGAAGDAGEPRR